MRTKLFIYLLAITTTQVIAQTQTNITITNPLARAVVHGNYNPNLYVSSSPISNHAAISQTINNQVSADSLKAYIIELGKFGNRNSGSDTLSSTRGIGAARRWVYNKFVSFSAASENRLLPSYLKFNQDICTILTHSNVMAVLPGSDTTNKEIIIIEGHIDSRCVGLCDTLCSAEGIEDNATGTALVIELARVMSKLSLKYTVVFLVTIAEEQGLYGAMAMMNYVKQNKIPIRAVLNNDVIGGILCGKTSSAPSCPGLDDVDSLQVRLFSAGGFNSKHKQLARFIKLQYKEELLPFVSVPMSVTVMSAKDRTGRGGDHLPFSDNNYAAMRFTSANEHGDASNGAGYTDRQHSSRDVLGVDTNGDSEIDSFFVDFNYLARNTAINGVSAAMAAIGPKTPEFSMQGYLGPNTITVVIADSIQDPNYRIAIRSTTNDWDTLFTTNQLTTSVTPNPATSYIVSVASVDANGVESLFSNEIIYKTSLAVDELENKENSGIQLLQNHPNPFDEATLIGVKISGKVNYKTAQIQITDMSGKVVQSLTIDLTEEVNEVLYEHGYGHAGTFNYSLILDGKITATKTMIFAN